MSLLTRVLFFRKDLTLFLLGPKQSNQETQISRSCPLLRNYLKIIPNCNWGERFQPTWEIEFYLQKYLLIIMLETGLESAGNHFYDVQNLTTINFQLIKVDAFTTTREAYRIIDLNDGGFFNVFQGRMFRCLVDATPSRTELQVSPCWQLLTSQVVWFFPFFSTSGIPSLFLSCIRTKTGFLSQWGGGLNADTWEFFWDGFTPLLKSLFLLFKAFNVDFHFALGVDYLPADIIVPHDRPNRSTVWRRKNVFTTTGFKVRLNWRISFQDRE